MTTSILLEFWCRPAEVFATKNVVRDSRSYLQFADLVWAVTSTYRIISCMLEMKPGGASLSAEQAKKLDDEFFLADPHAYFAGRISTLLQPTTSEPSTAEVDEFCRFLGIEVLGDTLAHEDSARDLQVALDAIAVRHHAAEALVRFLHALVAAIPQGDSAPCVWAAVTDGPTALHTVVTELRSALDADNTILWRLFFPKDFEAIAEHEEPFRVGIGWIERSMQLLTDNNLTLNAAHNKLKHGLAVRTRNDVRIELVVGPPPTRGEIGLSRFDPSRSLVVIDRPMVTYLARAFPARKQGLELTPLRVDPAAVLAEASMISWTYASYFASAATRHYGDSDIKSAPYPAPRSGPTPAAVVAAMGNVALGYRVVVTVSPDETVATRPSGLYLPDSFLPMAIDFDNVLNDVVVVDDGRSDEQS